MTTPTPVDTEGRDVERKLLSGELSYADLNANQKYAYDGVRMSNQRQVYGVGATRTNTPPVYTPGIEYDPNARKNLEQEFMKQLDYKAGSGFKLPGWMKPVEKLASGMYWVYSKAVSQPLSFAYLGQRELMDYLITGDEVGSIKDIWNDARYTSPGQAIYLGGMTNQQLRSHGIDPSNLAASRKEVDKFFDNGPQMWATGIGDLTLSFIVDPFVAAGKGAGALRRATYVKPTSKSVKYTDEFAASKTVDAISRSVKDAMKGGTPDAAIAKLVDTVPFFEKNKTNGVGQVLAEFMVHAGGDKGEIARIIQFASETNVHGAGFKGQVAHDRMLEKAWRDLTNRRNDLGVEKLQLTAAKADPAEIAAVEARLQGAADEAAKVLDAVDESAKLRQIWGSLDALHTRNNIGPAAARIRQSVLSKPAWRPLRAEETQFRIATPSGPGAVKAQAGGSSIMRRGGDLVYNGTLFPIVAIYKAVREIRPNYYLKVEDAESYRHLDAILRDSKVMALGDRQTIVGQYIKADVKDRPMILQHVEQSVTQGLASKYGIEVDTARALYAHFSRGRGQISSGNAYTIARRADGSSVNYVGRTSAGVDQVVQPVLKSQLADNWVLMDFDRMEKIIKRSGNSVERMLREDPDIFDKLAQGRIKGPDGVGSTAEALNSFWKFSQLARPGYPLRAIGDELATQVAALGPLMMMARVTSGVKNIGTQAVKLTMNGGWMHNLEEATKLSLVQMDGNIADLSSMITKNESNLARLNERQIRATTPAKRRDLRRDYDRLKHDTDNMIDELSSLRSDRGVVNNQLATSVNKNINLNGATFAGAYQGVPGQAMRSVMSATRSFDNLLGRSASNTLFRARGAGWAPVTAAQGEAAHMSAWLRVINHQIVSDPLALMRVEGKTVEEMAAWLRTTKGMAHHRSVARRSTLADEYASDVATHVDHYFPEEMLGRAEVMAAASAGKLDGKMLKDSMPQASMRPDVHGEQFNYAVGKNGTPGGEFGSVVDKTMTTFYRWMNELPAQHLSRNPLFAMLYKSHVKEFARSTAAGGRLTHLTPSQYEAIENAARKRSLRQTKELTFNMDYEARLAYMLRFAAPFFGAQLESWTRWSRVVADKPQILAHAFNLYNSPARSGNATTVNGDHIDGYGMATNSETGEKYKVDKSEVMINMQIPQDMQSYIAEGMGINVTDMRIPVNSLNLVLQNEPLFSPGFGPLIQIPANNFVKTGKLGPIPTGIDSWSYGDALTEIGVLPPGGVQKDAGDMLIPAWFRRFYDADDQSSQEYIGNFKLIMDQEMWSFENGGREKPPTAREIQDKARKFTFFTAFSQWVAPARIDYVNPMEFYSDSYKKIQASGVDDPQKAFLDKYGESMWMFTTSINRSNNGMQSTRAGMKMTQGYQDLIDELEDPSLAALIGGNMDGLDFSKSAYVYQLTHETQTGSGQMQRERLAPQEIMAREQENKGWYMYNKEITKLQSQLLDAGYSSFEEKGAERFAAMRKGIIANLANPEFQGKPNKFYNEAWSKQFMTIDRLAIDRRIADLRKIVSDPGLQSLSNLGIRTDIGTLNYYLTERDAFTAALDKRKASGGSGDIKAKSNEDLRIMFSQFADSLIEGDTRFGELHTRYLQRDMGYIVMKGEAID